MQADIGRAAVQAVVFGDRDLKRYLLAEPQRAAEADHDARIGKCRYVPPSVKSRIGPSRKSFVRLSRRYQEARPFTLIRGVSRCPASTRAPRSS